jgi:hypothetical protein
MPVPGAGGVDDGLDGRVFEHQAALIERQGALVAFVDDQDDGRVPGKALTWRSQ